MHGDRFDALARALAGGASRRDVLKGLVGGAAASLLAVAGYSSRRSHATPQTPQATHTTYLPLVMTACSVASVCGERQYCSSDETCLCIETAEGDIRCGEIPSCSADLCETSADCAHLGPGYFCDAPNSGCCDEYQRCIAPCNAGEPAVPCPPERICGTTCCPEGQICLEGACAQEDSAVWDGSVTYNTETIGIRFILDQNNGDLSGRMLMKDPETDEYLETGEVNGSRSGGTASWTTENGSVIEGSFSGDDFSGTMTFRAMNGEPSVTADVSLTVTTAALAAPAVPARSY